MRETVAKLTILVSRVDVFSTCSIETEQVNQRIWEREYVVP